MNFSFDHYHKLENPVFYLCNPNMVELGALVATNRKATLRFNDLSEITFDINQYVCGHDGVRREHPYYSLVETRRLIRINEIGWFQITQVQEVVKSGGNYKSVTAQSHQCRFKDIGFQIENRVYKFYDPQNPVDTGYDSLNKGHIPSVVGQMHNQLGIELDIHQTNFDPSQDYGVWTLVYIDPSLHYIDGATDNICRTFQKDEATFGYDFMVGDAEEAFEVIFEFDFLHHAIKVLRIEDITEKTNIYLSLSNIVNKLEVNEKADDIVTVLNCNGEDVNITSVNPSGTNYICDFSYYMDELNHRWMSQPLIDRIKSWSQTVDDNRTAYSTYVSQMRDLYGELSEKEEKKMFLVGKNEKKRGVKYADLEKVRDQYIEDPSNGNYIFAAEMFEVGEKSIDPRSPFNSVALTGDEMFTCYGEPPTLVDGVYTFNIAGVHDSLNGIIARSLATNNPDNVTGFLYFVDYNGLSYCQIVAGVRIVDDQEQLYVYGVRRFSVYRNISEWIDLYDGVIRELEQDMERINECIDSIRTSMTAITDVCNITKAFENDPALLRELRHYWIEGEYTNNNIAVLENTTIAQTIDLANELMGCGARELSRVCQPKFSLSVDAINFFNIYEFKQFTYEIALGKVITVEKDENTHYYPALTEMSFSFDANDDFSLVFSNALKPNEWGFTYADMIANSAKTSRTVSANWSLMTQYSKERDSLYDIIRNPLDRVLQLTKQGMVNQSFAIDTTGILGRKMITEGTFESEQIRLVNNVLVFTDDNWATAKTALGKVSYTEEGVEKQAYGLVGEVIVGSLMMSNRLKICNGDNTIDLGENGITIKKSDGNVVFSAKPDGTLVVSNYATSQDLSALSGRVNTAESSLSVLSNEIALKVSSTDFNALYGRVTTAESAISAQGNKLSMLVYEHHGTNYINSAEIMLAINGNNSWVKISADQINLDGIVTVGKLSSETYEKVALTTLTNDTISTTNVTATNLKVKAANIDGTLTATQINGTGLNVTNATITDCTILSNLNASNVVGGKLSADVISSNTQHLGTIYVDNGYIGDISLSQLELEFWNTGTKITPARLYCNNKWVNLEDVIDVVNRLK